MKQRRGSFKPSQPQTFSLLSIFHPKKDFFWQRNSEVFTMGRKERTKIYKKDMGGKMEQREHSIKKPQNSEGLVF